MEKQKNTPYQKKSGGEPFHNTIIAETETPETETKQDDIIKIAIKDKLNILNKIDTYTELCNKKVVFSSAEVKSILIAIKSIINAIE